MNDTYRRLHLNPFEEMFWFNHRYNEYEHEIITPEEWDKIPADNYVHLDNCYICGKHTLVCSGTGCCWKCDASGPMERVI